MSAALILHKEQATPTDTACEQKDLLPEALFFFSKAFFFEAIILFRRPFSSSETPCFNAFLLVSANPGKLVFVERSRLAFARQHPPWQRSVGVPLSAAVRVCALCFAPGFVPAACTAVKGPARSATGNHLPRCLPLTALPPAGMGQTTGQRGTPALRPASNNLCQAPFSPKVDGFQGNGLKSSTLGFAVS